MASDNNPSICNMKITVVTCGTEASGNISNKQLEYLQTVIVTAIHTCVKLLKNIRELFPVSMSYGIHFCFVGEMTLIID